MALKTAPHRGGLGRINLTLGRLCNNLTVVSIVTASALQHDLCAHTKMTHFLIQLPGDGTEKHMIYGS